jgi:hypothetical protein
MFPHHSVILLQRGHSIGNNVPLAKKCLIVNFDKRKVQSLTAFRFPRHLPDKAVP